MLLTMPIPGGAADPDNIPFGINVEPLWGMDGHEEYDWDDVFADIDYIRDGNPITLRIGIRAQWVFKCPKPSMICPGSDPYCHFETGPSSYIAHIDRIIAEASERQLPILAILHGTPPWNDGNPATSCDERPGNDPPVDVYWWTDFVGAMVERFPYIDQWEIWNEPDLDESFTGSATTFAQKVYVPAYQKITSISNDRVIGPGIAYRNEDWSWEGGGNSCDWIVYAIQNLPGNPNPPFYAFNFHQYQGDEGSPPYYLSDMVGSIFSVRDDINSCAGMSPDFRLYLTEYGQKVSAWSCLSDADHCEQCGDIEYFMWYQIMGYDVPSMPPRRPASDKHFIYALYDGNADCKFGLCGSPGFCRCSASMHRCKINQHYHPKTICPNFCHEPLCVGCF
jgi:hypothetical protein